MAKYISNSIGHITRPLTKVMTCSSSVFKSGLIFSVSSQFVDNENAVDLLTTV